MKKSNYNSALLNHYITPWWSLVALAFCFGLLAVVSFGVGIPVAIVFSIFSTLVALVSGVFALINLINYMKSLNGRRSHWIDLN